MNIYWSCFVNVILSKNIININYRMNTLKLNNVLQKKGVLSFN